MKEFESLKVSVVFRQGSMASIILNSKMSKNSSSYLPSIKETKKQHNRDYSPKYESEHDSEIAYKEPIAPKFVKKPP